MPGYREAPYSVRLSQSGSPPGLHQLGRLDHEDRVDLLVLVERDTAADSPLWSVMLAAARDGTALRRHRDVSARLSRFLPVGGTELIDQLAVERNQLHRQR
ncbi:hypothetical protein AB0919_42635 [Streptomyces sp. NPDC046994]|uniref:hypothetical protein n=1 Tax=unclassified Streptomyces TaxID=2593676 RepID=UPI0033F9C166